MSDSNIVINNTNESSADDNFTAEVISHIIIRDVETDETLVNQRG
jgi:hypothetical protein